MPSSEVNGLNLYQDSKSSLQKDETADYVKSYGLKLDIIRFLAICSIIWGHTVLEWEVFSDNQYVIIHSVLQQLGKIGTINFLILSGFLLNKRINQFNIISYINYRKFSLILPWFIFLSLFVAIHSYKSFNQGLIFKGSFINSIKEITGFYRNFIVYNAYWFVPVSIMSGCVLIIFKNYLGKSWFFALILAGYLFYCVNLYYAWISQVHTKAFFAYIIFMWIGLQISRNIILISATLEKINWAILILLISLMFSIACYEGIYLSSIGSADAYASLRISNSVLSILVFVLFLKLPSIRLVKILRPSYYVFGVYLIQAIIIDESMPIIRKYISIGDNSILNVLFSQCLVFILIFSIAYLLTVIIARSKMKFIVGKRSIK